MNDWMPNRRCNHRRPRNVNDSAAQHDGFTLVELLVVLTIFLLVSAVALPTFRSLLSDQKVSQSSRTMAAYLDEARSRAVAEGRYVGVRIERVGIAAAVEFQTSAGVRLRQLIGVPPYNGEAADAKVTFDYPPPVPPATLPSTTATLEFRGVDNQLLLLYTDPNSALFDSPNAPIADGDLIELPGGRYFRLDFTGYNAGTDTVTATIDLNSPISGSDAFPMLHQPIDNAQVAYRIYRSPVVSTTKSLAFPRGIVVDMNYSGVGIDGNQFAPQATVANQPIDIVFGPDGRVETASLDSTGVRTIPSGLIFLCVGGTDGVQPATLFNASGRTPANLRSPESVWIVINPATGRSVVSPNATVSTTSSMGAALREARSLAVLSDTLDANP